MNSGSDLKITDIRAAFRDRKPGAEEGFKFFSVLVPVVEQGGRLHLLYEVRAKHMARQPGEVCFPGGELEQDESACQCALRETWEEVGIPAASIEIVNRLDTIYTYSNFAMYCYLGILEPSAMEALRLNRDEVEEVFLVPLEDLIRREPEIYRTEIVPRIPEDFPYQKVTGGKPYNWRKGSAPVPVYDVEGRIIWGLTARITKRFIDVIKERISESPC